MPHSLYISDTWEAWFIMFVLELCVAHDGFGLVKTTFKMTSRILQTRDGDRNLGGDLAIKTSAQVVLIAADTHIDIYVIAENKPHLAIKRSML
jgi:hypothetical protein